MSVGPTETEKDRSYLERARVLAHAGWGQVHPNPLVGCVLVRDGEIVGEGHHATFGGPHAEIAALKQAKSRAEGATAYVSLEPCDHHGKTPPCSEALVQAGVSRVVFGAVDPHPDAGGGAATLRQAGLEVVGPVWNESVSQAENPAFFFAASRRSPFVALKLAMTLDGRIASGPGEQTRITGIEAEQEVHRLRTGFDAIMIGVGTARVDDPRLTVRMVPQGRVAPRRIVLDPEATLRSDAVLFGEVDTVPLHVFTRKDAPEADLERLEAAGAHVHSVAAGDGGLELPQVMSICWELGIRSILCEGGARLTQSLLRGGFASRLYLFVAPATLGPKGVSAFGEESNELDWDAFDPAAEPLQFGRDTLMVLDRRRG